MLGGRVFEVIARGVDQFIILYLQGARTRYCHARGTGSVGCIGHTAIDHKFAGIGGAAHSQQAAGLVEVVHSQHRVAADLGLPAGLGQVASLPVAVPNL